MPEGRHLDLVLEDAGRRVIDGIRTTVAADVGDIAKGPTRALGARWLHENFRSHMKSAVAVVDGAQPILRAILIEKVAFVYIEVRLVGRRVHGVGPGVVEGGVEQDELLGAAIPPERNEERARRDACQQRSREASTLKVLGAGTHGRLSHK